MSAYISACNSAGSDIHQIISKMSISICAQTVMLLQSIRAFRKTLIKQAQCVAHPMAGVRDKPLSRLTTSVAGKSK